MTKQHRNCILWFYIHGCNIGTERLRCRDSIDLDKTQRALFDPFRDVADDSLFDSDSDVTLLNTPYRLGETNEMYKTSV
jgi:hypothetical protein